MRVWFDDQDSADAESVIIDVSVIPRVGERVGYRRDPHMPDSVFILDKVVEVRHYPTDNEVHVMTSARFEP